ncbi:MAG: translation initiation factor IF-3 [Fimbriimonadaceae bacterium]
MINERVLRFRDVRVVGEDGEQLGILQSRQALNLAREAGLDLVLVAPNAQPPVCRIIDYGRFKYTNEKRERENKKKTQEVKGIKISPRISDHDLGHLTRNAIKFLEEGHKVKVTCMFRAREVTRPEVGRNRLDVFAQQTSEVSVIERAPSMDGRLMTMILAPKPASQRKKDVKTENEQDGREAVQDHGDGQDHPAEGV